MPQIGVRHSFVSPMVLLLGMLLALGACRRKEPATPPVATPSVKLAYDRAPLGSPIDVT